MIKQELTKRTTTTTSAIDVVEESESNMREEKLEPEEVKYRTCALEELLRVLHKTLLECQNLGDQKVRIASQIIETICAKTRQLGLDCKSNGKLNV